MPLDREPDQPEPPALEPVPLPAYAEASPSVNLAASTRARRHPLGLSQRQLAGRLGTVRVYASKLENLKCKPTLGSLEKIARALETTIPHLLNARERTRQ